MIGIAFAAALSACGGGGGDADTGLSDSNIDYRAAYFRVVKGMAPDQVISTVGTKPYAQTSYNGHVTAIHWNTGIHEKNRYETLVVHFTESKASWKLYGGRLDEKYEQFTDSF